MPTETVREVVRISREHSVTITGMWPKFEIDHINPTESTTAFRTCVHAHSRKTNLMQSAESTTPAG